jgi:hypothetical protein
VRSKAAIRALTGLAGSVTAIDVENLASGVWSLIRCDEDDPAGNLLRRARFGIGGRWSRRRSAIATRSGPPHSETKFRAAGRRRRPIPWVSLCDEAGDDAGQAEALNNLGMVRQFTGDYPSSLANC